MDKNNIDKNNKDQHESQNRLYRQNNEPLNQRGQKSFSKRFTVVLAVLISLVCLAVAGGGALLLVNKMRQIKKNMGDAGNVEVVEDVKDTKDTKDSEDEKKVEKTLVADNTSEENFKKSPVNHSEEEYWNYEDSYSGYSQTTSAQDDIYANSYDNQTINISDPVLKKVIQDQLGKTNEEIKRGDAKKITGVFY